MNGTYIGLWCAQLELNDADLRLLYPGRAADSRNDILVEDNTIHELGILDSTANLLDDTDVTKIYIR